MSDIIPGFVPGIVKDNRDPEGTGRIKVALPGRLEITPYWVMPMFPAQGRGRGSQYPPPDLEHHVGVIFEYGIWRPPNSRAFYFGGYYGIESDGSGAGPTIVSSQASAQEARNVACLWESSKLAIYVEDNDETGAHKVVMKAKTSGSKVEIDAAAGDDGNSEVVRIYSRTLLEIYAMGPIDIASDTYVDIQGRRVNDLSSKGI